MSESTPTIAATEGEESAGARRTSLDEISLEQALLDFDVANARVLDLTQRLTSLNKELLKKTTAMHNAQIKVKRLEAELTTLKASAAFRSAAVAVRAVRSARSRLGR